MIGWPLWAEQYQNCRFCKEIWNIAIDIESRLEDDSVLVRREEVEKVIRVLMIGSEGKELRKNVLKLKEIITKAVMTGGSSSRNLDKFAQDMITRASLLPR
ncbi:hypothetical protein SUGI_1063610 [Cryptomeria japonica]|nr:hypothetical protein SUGI_1063610 [Cryptomeria japonica]